MTARLFSHASASMSACGVYRYQLRREWGASLRGLDQPRVCLFVMLNPSTADAIVLDPTVRRCIAFADALGCTTLLVGNLFALRSTDSKALYAHAEPVGHPENDIALHDMAREADLIIAAWGAHGALHGRGERVLDDLASLRTVHALATTKDGHPGHPLYLPKTARPVVLCELRGTIRRQAVGHV